MLNMISKFGVKCWPVHIVFSFILVELVAFISFFVFCFVVRQLVARGSDQLESLSSFGHCAHFTLMIYVI